MFGRRTKARVAGKAARGAGRALLKSRTARTAARGGAKGAIKTARGAGKVALKGGTQAVSPGESAATRFLKYGLVALAAFTVGALVARMGREREVGTPFGQGGETWGTGTPLGTAGAPSDPARPQTLSEPRHTGAEREYSDPSKGPLIGRQHHGAMPDIPEQQIEVEQRIRSRIGTDPRTSSMPRVNVEVNDGVAELRGEAPSEEVKAAAEEIATETEGVLEVRNLLTVNPQSPTRHRRAGGPDQPV